MKKTLLSKQVATVSAPPEAPPPRRPPPTGDVQADNPDPPEPSSNPRSRVPKEEDKDSMEKLYEDQDKRLSALFSDDEPAPEPEPPKPEPPKPEPPKPEPPKPESKEGDEVDYNAPPPGTTEAERETAAQKRAKETGEALKLLETKHQELELERNRLKDEVELLKKSSSSAPVRREDVLAHPEVRAIGEQIATDCNAVAGTQLLSEAGEVLEKRFKKYMDTFVAKASTQDPTEAKALDLELRQAISEDFKAAYKDANRDEDGPDGYKEDFSEAEMNSGAKDFTRDVLQLLVRNAGKYQQAQETIDKLVSKAREGTLAQNVEVYQFHETDLGTALDAIPNIPEAAIAENPHTVEATVAGLLKQDAWKERFSKTRKDVLELLLGPKVLTQKELDSMQEGGMDVKEFNKRRQKAFLDRRKKLAVQIAQSLLIRSLWESTVRDAELYRGSRDELDILSRGKPKTGDPAPPPAPKKPAGEFRSAVEDVLEEAEGRRR